jgi:hypothetical protein
MPTHVEGAHVVRSCGMYQNTYGRGRNSASDAAKSQFRLHTGQDAELDEGFILQGLWHGRNAVDHTQPRHPLAHGDQLLKGTEVQFGG